MSQPSASAPPSLHRWPTRGQLTAWALDRWQDRPCLYVGGTLHSYADVRDSTSQFCQVLEDAGCVAGTGVSVLAGNRAEVLSVQIATSMLGARSTGLHPLGSLDDHAYVLERAQVRTLVFDPAGFEERARQLSDRLPDLTLLSLGPSDVGQDILALARERDPGPLDPVALAPDDLTGMPFTGGTTGAPKGVRIPGRAGIYMTMIQMLEWEWPSQMRVLVATPLSHAAGSLLLPTILRGGAMYVLERFTPAHFFEAVEEHQITTTMLVPTMLYALLDSPECETADTSSLETIFYGASPISPRRLAEALDVFGRKFFQFYGQTEAPMCLATLKRDEHDPDVPGRLSSCGRPVPWLDVQILDDDHQPLAAGQPGEVCVRGPLVCDGYHDDPSATSALFAGGWLHTGDIGVMDEDGYLTLIDRKKDLIVSGGFNVFPGEIERLISQVPGVAQVAVIGVPDERWGEAVTAVVVAKPGTEVDRDAIVQLVRDAKGSVYAPKAVDVVDDIPVSPLGKPDKRALRARYWQGEERQIG